MRDDKETLIGLEAKVVSVVRLIEKLGELAYSDMDLRSSGIRLQICICPRF